jgi:hypothetical protein
MSKINNKDFLIISKYKSFIINLDNLLDNIPKKDIIYKDRIKSSSIDILKSIFIIDNSSNINEINNNYSNIKANISLIDFYLERFLLKRYLSNSNVEKLTIKLIEINKMSYVWVNNKIKALNEN